MKFKIFSGMQQQRGICAGHKGRGSCYLVILDLLRRHIGVKPYDLRKGFVDQRR